MSRIPAQVRLGAQRPTNEVNLRPPRVAPSGFRLQGVGGWLRRGANLKFVGQIKRGAREAECLGSVWYWTWWEWCMRMLLRLVWLKNSCVRGAQSGRMIPRAIRRGLRV